MSNIRGMFLFGKHPILVSYQVYKHYFAFNGSRFWSRHRTCWMYVSWLNFIPHLFYKIFFKFYEV